MLIRVDPLGDQPLFEQIAFAVKGAVARGEVSPGDRLPSVRELAKSLGINPNTVVKALDALEREGVVVRRQGAGCFVREGSSALNDHERGRRLDELATRLVTEAYHLGFRARDVRDAVSRAIDEVRFPTKGRS